MENKKITLWVIIILLIIFLPMTIFSSIMHFKNPVNKEENSEKKFKQNGKLYFYLENQPTSIYTCENPDGYCDYALVSHNYEYPLNEREIKKATKLPVNENRYVFITDSKTEELKTAPILLYDLSLNKVLKKYKEVKNYGIGINNDYYLLKDEKDKWGVISFEDGIKVYLPFEYDYIGLVDKVDTETNKIEANIFAVLKENEWQLIDSNGAVFTNSLSTPIFSYNSEYIVLKENDMMRLVDYQNNTVLNNYKYINFYNKYLEIIDRNDMFYLYDLNNKRSISKSYEVDSIEDINLEIKENAIEIKKNDTLLETVAINDTLR